MDSSHLLNDLIISGLSRFHTWWFSLVRHKTTEQTKVLSKSDVYFVSPPEPAQLSDAQLNPSQIDSRHLDNPPFFRQSQQHASKANCRTHVSTRILRSSARHAKFQGSAAAASVPPPFHSFISNDWCAAINARINLRGKASRQS